MPRRSSRKDWKKFQKEKQASRQEHPKEKEAPLSGEEMVIKCLLDPRVAKSRAKAHAGAFAEHEIRRYIEKNFGKESLAKTVENWLPPLLKQMSEDGKLVNVNAGVANIKPFYLISKARLQRLVEIEYITPEEANP
eukprot:EG_transcript_45738